MVNANVKFQQPLKNQQQLSLKYVNHLNRVVIKMNVGIVATATTSTVATSLGQGRKKIQDIYRERKDFWKMVAAVVF